MPKSKRRKMNHAPQPTRANIAATAATVSASGTVMTSTGTAPRKQSQNAPKGPPVAQYVSTELKVIGVITILIIVAIVVLYFVLR